MDRIRWTLQGYDINPEQLRIELTESVLMDNPDLSLSVLQQFRELGMRIAIDDFGTGYSSLSYLNQFPLDCLKIDRSFVQGLTQGEKSATIIESIVTLARRLDLTIVAEGVETIDQLNALRELKCDWVQGFLLARPLKASAAEELLLNPARWRGHVGRYFVFDPEPVANPG